jgi:hypothetical protein
MFAEILRELGLSKTTHTIPDQFKRCPSIPSMEKSR